MQGGKTGEEPNMKKSKRIATVGHISEVMAIGRQLHQAERQFHKLRNHKVLVVKSTFSCEMETSSLRNFAAHVLTSSEDVSSENEWPGFSFLELRKLGKPLEGGSKVGFSRIANTCQSNSQDFSSEDERLSSLSLGVKKAGQVISVHGDALVYLLRAFGSWFKGKSKVKDHLECCACHIEYEIAEEAMNFLSYVAELSRGWDEPNARDMGRMTSQPNAKAEMYILKEKIDMKAKIAAMARRLEELEMKKMQEMQAISQTPLQAMPCAICLSYEHLVEECPTIPVVREMFGDCNTYNSNWRDHPNFSWKPQPPQYQQPAQAPQDVKVVITLRSGKEVDLTTSKQEHETGNETEKKKMEEIKGKRKGIVSIAIIQCKSLMKDANFIWDPGKLKQDNIFFDGLSLSKD
ncbi:hypothetical protein CK203_048031 [Vitis vinifera]|uniref:Uncharacterized protein n=1 Tax=Vitis vinifera TaxID=29760 RepID=A0A438GZ47_VITVI|nr:hypothetical protein CK203_048031 [Vitis vinifera]